MIAHKVRHLKEKGERQWIYELKILHSYCCFPKKKYKN